MHVPSMVPIDPTGHERISLEKATMHLLEECRMVLPGIQMTFGFQLIVVFNGTFQHLLTWKEKLWHLGAISAVALAAALVMAPAAFHRHVEPMAVSGWLLRLSSRLLMWSMFPLAIGLCIDLYLLARLLLPHGGSMTYATAMFLLFLSLWFILPRAVSHMRIFRQRQ